MTASRARWSDDDKHFGPFMYAYSPRYKPFAAVLSSVDDEHYSYDERNPASFRLSALGHTVIITLPAILPPETRKVYPGWDEPTVARLGRNWYWDVIQREFGFSYQDGFLQVFRGRRTNDSSTDQTKSWFLPWTQWRHVRHSFYEIDGRHFWDEPNASTSLGDWPLRQAKIDKCSTAKFEFKDFDGERLSVTCRIEEREWRFGTGYFEWLSAFRKPKIIRSLCLEFSKETGRRKGSWKGGTIGHAIDMRSGEPPESAFRRYCAEHEMTFIG